MKANGKEPGPRQPASPGRRRPAWFVVLVLSWAVTVFAALPLGAWQLPSEPQFENPALLYEGPDPTASFFLPASAAQWRDSHSGGVFMEGAPQEMPLLVAPGDPSGPPMLTMQPGDNWGDPRLPSGRLKDTKDGFFQKLGVSWTWIDRGAPDGFGLNELDSFVMVAIPAPSREWPLVISPTFNARLIEGPNAPDLPPAVYEAFVDFMWLPRFSPCWSAVLSVAPSYYGDFQVDAGDAFRLTGRALARFDWIPGRLKVLFGVLYLNRDDVPWLPAGGFIWTPNDAVRYELLFPKPKLAHRIKVGANFEDWIYFGAEFGGNTYGIERVSGLSDKVTFRDLRAYFGLERKKPGGAGYRLEIGYVFDRSAEYDSATPDIHAPSTAMLRGAWTY